MGQPKVKRVRVADPKSLERVRGVPVHLEIPRGIRAARDKVPDYIPTPAAEVNAPKFCLSGIKKRGKKALRDCHVELLFVGKQLSQKLQVKTGSYLQVCKKFGEPGDLIPVKDHTQLQAMSKKYCACRQERKGTIAACKTEIVEQARTGQLGRARRRRR